MSYRNFLTISSLALALITLTLFSSCSDTVGTKEVQTDYDLNENLTVEDGQNQFSQTFISMGIVEAKIEKNRDKTNINFVMHNAIFEGEHNTKQQSLYFYIKDEVLHLDGKPNLGVGLVNNSPYIITENYNGPLENFRKSDLSKDLTLLLFALEEVTSNNQEKIDARNLHRPTASGGCSFMNTVHVVYAGATRGAAEARLAEGKAGLIKEREEENGTSCSKLGGSGSSCTWGDAGCLSYQSYCCK